MLKLFSTISEEGTNQRKRLREVISKEDMSQKQIVIKFHNVKVNLNIKCLIHNLLWILLGSTAISAKITMYDSQILVHLYVCGKVFVQ